MKYLSVCSGIEAATVAWHPLGWEAEAYSEIERFPCEVLAHHYPNTPNLGDMTAFKEWIDVSNFDVLVGGTPCQSFSVAGLRKGLDDPRGNLMLTYLAIAKRYQPRWLVWENVPGVLSSNGGRDFGSFLGGLAECGYGFAYRVLDAQYFGVAQRRKRVFVVGYLGDWHRAAAVLFERHSLQGHSAPSRKKGQSVAPTVTCGPPFSSTGNESVECEAMVLMDQGGSVINIEYDMVGTLRRETHGHEPVIVQGCEFGPSGGRFTDLNPTLDTGAKDGPIRNQLAGAVISIHPHCIGRAPEAGPQGKEYLLDGSAYCMDSRGQPQAVVQVIPFDTTQITSKANYSNPKMGDPYHPLAAGADAPTIAFPWQSALDPIGNPSDLCGTLIKNQTMACITAMQVRRLTPVECERLQGFPDGYTDIKTKAKPTPDGPRYKALGNSMAVPVMAWIGWQIAAVSAII